GRLSCCRRLRVTVVSWWRSTAIKIAPRAVFWRQRTRVAPGGGTLGGPDGRAWPAMRRAAGANLRPEFPPAQPDSPAGRPAVSTRKRLAHRNIFKPTGVPLPTPITARTPWLQNRSTDRRPPRRATLRSAAPQRRAPLD